MAATVFGYRQGDGRGQREEQIQGLEFGRRGRGSNEKNGTSGPHLWPQLRKREKKENKYYRNIQ